MTCQASHDRETFVDKAIAFFFTFNCMLANMALGLPSVLISVHVVETCVPSGSAYRQTAENGGKGRI